MRKNVRLICFIYDIDGIRNGDAALLKKDIAFLKMTDTFIVHSDKMLNWLKDQVYVKQAAVLQLFDFLTAPSSISRSKSGEIAFAANLRKSPFVYELHKIRAQDIVFNIYGEGADESLQSQKNVRYRGVFQPYEMPAIIEGSFGLVWDGTGIDTCEGSYGEYLRFNSQHKLSLYILSGLPVIVWKHAATAPLVEKYDIGFTVQSLQEISGRIREMHEESYRQMTLNLRPIAQKIASGGFLMASLEELFAHR